MAMAQLKVVISRVSEARYDFSKAEEVFSTNLPAVEPQIFRCPNASCGNRDSDALFTDPRSGDTICTNCGEVVQDHMVDRGAAKRNFEDKEDRNHHGPASDRLMPDSVNMRTSFHRVEGQEKSKLNRLLQISNQVEMDVSNIGNFGKASTRTGYKTLHKLEAFKLMNELAMNLQIHDAVIEKAKELFAKYREVKERVEKPNATVAACIMLSFAELLPKLGSLDVTYTSIRERDGLKNSAKESSYTTDVAAVAQETQDVALSCLPDKKMGVWEEADCQEWLSHVIASREGGKADKAYLTKACNIIVHDVKKRIDDQHSRKDSKLSNIPKDKDLMKIFGTTTISGRTHNLDSNNAISVVRKLTCGQQLLALKGKMKGVLNLSKETKNQEENVAIANVIEDAMQRRVLFEKMMADQKKLADEEVQRLRVEELMKLRGKEKVAVMTEASEDIYGNGKAEPKESIEEEKISPSSNVTDNTESAEDLLEDFFGDDLPIISAGTWDKGATTAAPAPAKGEGPPTKKIKKERSNLKFSIVRSDTRE